MSFLGLFAKKSLMEQSDDKMREASAFAEQMSDRSTAWFNRTGRPAQERPGFADEKALLHSLHEEAVALLHQHNAAVRRKHATLRAAELAQIMADKAWVERLRDGR